jgi:integrase
MSYYVNGKQIRQSTKTTDLKEAQNKLAEKVVLNVAPDKRTIGALLDGLIADYENNHRKSIDWVKRMVRVHLREPFGNIKIDAITKQMVLDFMDTQRKLGAKNATINLELVLLKRSFSIADAKFPRVSKLVVNNIRKGFLMPEDYVVLISRLPEYARPVFQFAYRTGCRLGEILNLQWRNINLTDNLVRLEPGETKNDEGRTIPMTSDLVRMFEALPHCCEYVFTKDGKRIKSIRKVWNSTVKEANFPGMLFHDLRRTSVRNLIRAGVLRRSPKLTHPYSPEVTQAF